MTIFTDTWRNEVDSQLKKMHQSTGSLRSLPQLYGTVGFVHSFLHDETKQMLRDELDTCHAQLPPAVQARFVSDLQDVQRFNDAYNELITYSVLQGQGLDCEYERKIDGLTPDWYVTRGSEQGACAVEVVTCHVPKWKAKELFSREYLDEHLRMVRCSGTVKVLSSIGEKNAPDLRTLRSWIVCVSTWLSANDTKVGDRLELGSMAFEFIADKQDEPGLQVIHQHPLYWIEPERLRDAIASA